MSLRTARRAVAASVVAGAASVFWAVPVAEAAYPGTNGDIAFSSTAGNNVAIYQVDPNDPVGTASSDSAATSELTLGGADVEPFYSPDGKTVYFSSDRDAAGDFVIYSISQGTNESASNPATELSAVSGDEANNDFSPSAAPDDETVVFNRDNTSLGTLYASKGASSVCTLYTPTEGLATASTSDGDGSRPVLNPVNPSELLFVGGDNDLHVLQGVQWTSGQNPCNQQSNITDTNLSAEVSWSSSAYDTGVDANPDWSSNGDYIIFNSSRGGGETLFIINMTTVPPSGYPIWPSLASSSGGLVTTEPVFSPDGTEIAYNQAKKGSSIYDQMLVDESNGQWQAAGSATNLTEQVGGGINFNSEPDWQPLTSPPPFVPESRWVPALPISALALGGSVFMLRSGLSRRRVRRA